MPISLHCPKCNAAWTIQDDSNATVSGRCPRCGSSVKAVEPAKPPLAKQAISLSSGMAAAGALLQPLAPDSGSPTLLEVEQARNDPRRRFGHFIVLSELGKGGMGAVYRAWDERLRRTVALKVVLSSTESSQGAVLQRFQREAHAIARLRHPNIVAVHDVGEIQGKPYLAMDYIVGQTLERRIGKRTGTILDTPSARATRLSLAKGVEIVRDMARAVQYAHEQGVIHRDLKPQNVMLDAKDHPYVLDFGLAKVRDDKSYVTKTQGAMGTPSYMPPEQAGGSSEEADERSDVYALGATLYHVVAGQPPFEGSSEINVITLLLTKDATPPSQYNRRAAGDLDTICLKCLEKDKRKRFQSAADLASELDRYLAGEPILTRPLGFVGKTARTLRRNAKTVVVASIAAVVSMALVAWPRVDAALEARRKAEATERTRQAILEAAKALRARVSGALEKSATKLAGLHSGPKGFMAEVAAVVSEVETTTAPLADEGSLRSELRSQGTAAGAKDTAQQDVDSAIVDALALLEPHALLARAARERGQGYQLLARPADAARERARAYRLDPAGEDGARAFLEIAEDLLDREDYPRALGLFKTIASRKLPAALQARGDVGAARSLLALEKPEAARSLLKRALSAKALGEKETAQARWIEAVSARLSGGVNGPVDAGWVIAKRLSPGAGPPEVFALGGDKLTALRLDKTGSRLVSVDQITAGPSPRTLVAMKTREGDRLAVATCEDGCSVELYRFESDHLILDRKLNVARDLRDPRILAAGPLSAPDQDDLVFQARRENGLSLPIVASDLSGQPQLQVVFDPLCYEFAATIADLDGDGRAELVLGIGQWKSYALKVYKSEPHAPLREVFSRTLGAPTGFSVGSAGGRPYVLASVDRVRTEDAIFQEEPGLAPDRPDAVWKLAWTGSEPTLEKVLERPFEERDRWRLWLPSPETAPWKSYPGAFVAGEYMDGSPRLVFVPPAGLPPVKARNGPAVGSLAIADLDGCGEPELVFSGSPLRVTGLHAVAETATEELPVAAATDASALDVGLDLLACGQPREAALALEAVIQNPATPPVEGSRARFALARAQALVGLHDRARKTCLALADADPRAAKEALLLASAHAEEGREIAAAVADLERLRKFETLSADEDREVERRLRRLRPLSLLKECVRIDRKTVATLPLEIGKPLFLRRSERGVRIMGRAAFPVEGDERAAHFRLPLRYDGSSFRLSMRFFVEHAGYDSGLTIAFVGPKDAEGGGGEGLGTYLECRGGGNVDTFNRTLGVNGYGYDVGEFDPSLPVNVELTYVQADAVVHAALEHRGISQKWDIPLGPLARGKASLQVSFRGLQGNFLSVDLVELVLSAPPGAVTIEQCSGSEKPLERALRAFSLDDPASAQDLLEGAGSNDRVAAFLAALALADSGKIDEAALRIAALRKIAPDETDALWARDVYGLEDAERSALEHALARESSPQALVERAMALLRQGRAGEAAIAYAAAGEAGRGMHVLEQAQAWQAAGRFEEALALAEPVAHEEPSIILAGFAAFELGRHALAAEIWDRIADLPADLRVYRERSRRLSREATPGK